MGKNPQTILKGYQCDGQTSARQDFFNIQKYLTNRKARKEKERDKHSYGSHKIKGQQTVPVSDRQ